MINNIIVVSDLHCGCQLGLCPPVAKLDSGGEYKHSKLQAKTWQMWLEFCDKWVPTFTKNEDFALVVNGDALDGVHHSATTQWSQNMNDQIECAKAVLEHILKNPKCKRYYHIRGTEAHVGKSGEHEEKLAKDLKSIPDENGNHARWEMWLRFGKHRNLVHFTHHVGTSSSASYESTAVHKEMVEAYTEAGKQGADPPDVVVRSHRHRYFKTEVATKQGYGIAIVTAGWQLKTPFTFRIGLGRSAAPQIGGINIRSGEVDAVYTRAKTWHIERPNEVSI